MKKKYQWMQVVDDVLTVPNSSIQHDLRDYDLGDNWEGYDSEENALKAFESLSYELAQEMALITFYTKN